MEPISIILAALSAGAVAAIKDTASQTIKDTYAGLKAMIQKRLVDKSKAESTLTQYEKKPDVWEMPLKDTLTDIGVDKDLEIIQKAQHLLKLINPQLAAQGKYNIQIGKYNLSIEGNASNLHIGDNITRRD